MNRAADAVRRFVAEVVRTSPDWLRHALIVWASTAGGVVLKAVIAAEGVTGVDWSPTLLSALDTGAAAAAAGLLLLATTPATRRYGVGSSSATVGPGGADGGPGAR